MSADGLHNEGSRHLRQGRLSHLILALLVSAFLVLGLGVGMGLVVDGPSVLSHFGLAVNLPQENQAWVAGVFGVFAIVFVIVYRGLRKRRMFGEVCWSASTVVGLTLAILFFWLLLESRERLGIPSRATVGVGTDLQASFAEQAERQVPEKGSDPQHTILAYILAVLLDNGWFQLATMSCFFVGLTALTAKLLAVRSEKRITRQKLMTLLQWPTSDFRVDQAQDLLKNHQRTASQLRTRALMRRVEHLLQRIENTKSTAGLDQLMENLSRIDAESSTSSFGGVNFLIYVMPAIGFLGTIYGVGQSIYGFSLVLPRAQDFAAIVPDLTHITTRLGTAFDTTLLALVCSALTSFVAVLVRQAEDSILGQIDMDCVELFRGLVHEDPGTQRIVEALNRLGGAEFTEELRKHVQELNQHVQSLCGGLATAQQGFTQLSTAVNNQIGQFNEAVTAIGNSWTQLSSQVLRGIQDEMQKMVTGLSQALAESDFRTKLQEVANTLQTIGANLDQLRTSSQEQLSGYQSAAKDLQDIAAQLKNLDQRFTRLSELLNIRQTLEQIVQKGVDVRVTRGGQRPAGQSLRAQLLVPRKIVTRLINRVREVVNNLLKTRRG